jgi:hypothetical protein
MKSELSDIVALQRQRLKKVVDPVKYLGVVGLSGYYGTLLRQHDVQATWTDLVSYTQPVTFFTLLFSWRLLTYATQSLIGPAAFFVAYYNYRQTKLSMTRQPIDADPYMKVCSCFFCGKQQDNQQARDLHHKRQTVLSSLMQRHSKDTVSQRIDNLDALEKLLDNEISSVPGSSPHFD